MSDIRKRYMTVSMDVLEDGMNLVCWMSTELFWNTEKTIFPHVYTHMGDNCTWFIHSATELTVKAVNLIVETADRICREGGEINALRKAVNR